MKASQRAKARLPTINPEEIADKAADKAVDKIDKQNKYAIAKDTNKQFSLITNVLAKNAARVKTVERKIADKETKKPEASSKGTTLASLASSMSIIASSLDRINVLLAKTLGAQTPTAAPAAAPTTDGEPTAVRVTQKEDSGGLFNMLKSLFLNPAVVAAIAGIVYTVLPKEMQDKVKELLSGFGVGLEEAMGKNEEEGLGGFNTALKAAGIALTTYFGAKMIASIADAISTTLKIVKVFGGGKLGKGAAVLGGAAAVGAIGAAVLSRSKDEEEKPEGAPSPAGSARESSAPQATTESKPSSTGTGMKSSGGGFGIKPGGGGFGIKVPEMSGEDKPVMDMIKAHEGVRTKPYKDSLGLWTVGVGHLIGDGKSLPPEWNRELSMSEVDALFAKDYKHHKDAAEKIPGYDKLNASGKAALTDLTFNMGPGWYKKWPNFTKAMAAGDSESAAKSLEDSKWYSQVGNRAKTIVAMIRGGAQDVGNMMSGSTRMAANNPGEGTERVASSSNKGEQVKSLSQDIKVAVSTPKNETNINSVNGSRMEAANQVSIDPDSIPSPIAARGSLSLFTKHASSGIPMAT